MSVKIILLALETLLLFLFLVPLPVICSGNLLGIIVSVMLMIITANWTKFYGIISKIWGHGAGKFGLIFVSTLILAGIIYVGILSILMYKAQENRPEKANVIVVLGCQVKGERPSRMLRRRLDAAIMAMNDNPDTLCIVSGGKGDDEEISELGNEKLSARKRHGQRQDNNGGQVHFNLRKYPKLSQDTR